MVSNYLCTQKSFSKKLHLGVLLLFSLISFLKNLIPKQNESKAGWFRVLDTYYGLQKTICSFDWSQIVVRNLEFKAFNWCFTAHLSSRSKVNGKFFINFIQ